MSLDVKNSTNPAGDPVVVITLVGSHDIIRFADRMLEWQCEFGAAGRRILRSLRRRWGARAYDAYSGHLGLKGAQTAEATRRARAGA